MAGSLGGAAPVRCPLERSIKEIESRADPIPEPRTMHVLERKGRFVQIREDRFE